MKRFNNRNFFIIILLLGIGINTFLYLRISQATKELVNLRIQFMDLRQQESDLEELDKSFNELNSSTKQVSDIFPKDLPEVVEFLESMVNTASMSGVQVDFDIDDQVILSNKGTAKQIQIEIIIAGDYPSIIYYIDKTGKLPYYYDIEKLDIKPRTSGELECVMNIKLSIL